MLVLEALPLLTDRCVVHPTAGLAFCLRALQRLSVSRCRQLTFAALQALSARALDLRMLDMALIEHVEAAERATDERKRLWAPVQARLAARGCQFLRGAQIRHEG